MPRHHLATFRALTAEIPPFSSKPSGFPDSRGPNLKTCGGLRHGLRKSAPPGGLSASLGAHGYPRVPSGPAPAGPARTSLALSVFASQTHPLFGSSERGLAWRPILRTHHVQHLPLLLGSIDRRSVRKDRTCEYW